MEKAAAVLVIDPFNLSQAHNIKKLKDVAENDGQWRLRVGRYRIRYDIVGHTIVLHSIKHRRDAYR